jgi:hypothetical protein
MNDTTIDASQLFRNDEPGTAEDFSPSGDPDLTSGDFDIPTPYHSDWDRPAADEEFDQSTLEELAVA